MRITCEDNFCKKRGMRMKKVSWIVVITGAAVGLAAIVLTLL